MNIDALNPARFLIWWFQKTPYKLFRISKVMTQLVNHNMSFTLNLRLLFTPLYGDYTIIGRLIGVVVRIVFIFVGFFFVTFLGIITILLPISWYLLPIILFYYIDLWALVIIFLVYIAVLVLTKDTPLITVSKVKEQNYLDTFRPSVLKYAQNITNKNTFYLEKLFAQQSISNIFIIAELDKEELSKRLVKLISNSQLDNLSKECFELAKQQNTRYVELEQLFLVLISKIKNIDTILSEFKSSYENIYKSAEWILQKREDLAKLYIWQDAYEEPLLAGFGHGLTGRVTPSLDAISTDFTARAKMGDYIKFSGRDELIEEIAEFLGGANINLLLIGEPGSGKTSVVKNLANRIIRGTKYKTISNKRIVSINLGGLISGTRSYGDLAEKLEAALEDAIGSGDVILFIDEIHTLTSALGQEQEGSSNVFSILQPYLETKKVQFIGATNVENYRKHIEPVGSFANLFEVIKVPETDFEDTLKILKDTAEQREKDFNITVTMPSLLHVIKLSKKLVHDRVFPDKAIDVLNRASNSARKSADKTLTTSDIEKEIADMTNIPVSAVSEEESTKLLSLEDEMRKRVVGQDLAIKQVVSAIKRARTGIRDENKPIASFLFVGTTGVGKTETAKTLSGTFFGDRKAMIRLDMSEYQTPDSIDKLIGKSDASTKGILTEAVRSKPFAVILLDEIEKAHSQVILAFLQVLDDGRLTDSSGRTVDFTNTIIIATSNSGTKEIQEVTEKNGSYDEIKEVANKAVREHFAPEFLNRFTNIVVFKPLEVKDLKQIVLIMLDRVKNMAKEKSINISFNNDLIEGLITRGYNPQWGARPMARAIEETVENYLADKILKKELKQGSVIELGKEVFDYN